MYYQLRDSRKGNGRKKTKTIQPKPTFREYLLTLSRNVNDISVVDKYPVYFFVPVLPGYIFFCDSVNCVIPKNNVYKTKYLITCNDKVKYIDETSLGFDRKVGFLWPFLLSLILFYKIITGLTLPSKKY